MMKSEFIERVGFEPTAEEYEEIEQAYYNFEGDKDAFCKAFIENDGILKICEARAKKTELFQSRIIEMERVFKDDGERLEKRIAELTEALDRELEWHDCASGTALSEEDYAELENSQGTRKLTDDEAKQMIYTEFGFAPELVNIIHEANSREINRHGQTRIKNTYSRSPLYNASDWNYIKFDCRGWIYECVNGGLKQYDW